MPPSIFKKITKQKMPLKMALVKKHEEGAT
jgi:hypothetical protein